ncbi:cytochrome P450 [Mycolicibacillus parakoreensis]|uniref:Cytochrome P450 n=1 Tax=Mycolicibacillus parakoreensis TaxID=1069221 RepID=A0ABY3U1E5_9MYCO|nr:cytochrome P450 [Mycolicibacillus parakoreensis]MCV7317056.1 cytochrome P450 [Mycolicibacillus parakoreensis]ULN51387.1 cytochrome P450 [Mycolicibacillus parakoreensis]
MTDFATIDFFTDQSLVPDPHPYFDYLRDQHPVTRMDASGVVAVTGYAEALAIYRDSETYSNLVAVGGPFPPLPFEPEGDDISAQIEQYRDQMPMSEHMVTMDPPRHTKARSLLHRLLTPKRLKENQDFMWRLADRQLDYFVDNGRCEFLSEYARPFALLVIADLLGVPEEDQPVFQEVLGAPQPGARVGALDQEELVHDPLAWLDDKFLGYLSDRRENPRADVLTELAGATYEDGSVPELIDVVKSATFLFGAGQETTTKLLSSALRLLAERPDLVAQLRADRSKIPNFFEEVLRMESPVKCDPRLVAKTTTLGGVELKAGTIVVLLPGAVNRDPLKFEDPHEFRIDRPNVREHLAFARGTHTCPGSPLARAENRISLERILDRMDDIRIDEGKHGPAGDRRFTFEPTFILRGLTELHLEFTPVEAPVPAAI